MSASRKKQLSGACEVDRSCFESPSNLGNENVSFIWDNIQTTDPCSLLMIFSIMIEFNFEFPSSLDGIRDGAYKRAHLNTLAYFFSFLTKRGSRCCRIDQEAIYLIDFIGFRVED